MSSDQKPLVYLVLGASGSGRREVLVDLIEGALGEEDRPAVLLAEGETSQENDTKLPRLNRWRWQENAIVAELPEDSTHVFFITDGRANPIDQVEAFKSWIAAQDAELGRVICVVNCQLAEKNPPLLVWYEACIHFADVVLLNRREGVENKWLSDFQQRFKDQFYPCLFEFVKGGRVKNPPLILEPEARRLSHVFDEEPNWVVTDESGEEIDEESDAAEDEELTAAPEEDPYFARRPNGRRQKDIPEIAKYLPGLD